MQDYPYSKLEEAESTITLPHPDSFPESHHLLDQNPAKSKYSRRWKAAVGLLSAALLTAFIILLVRATQPNEQVNALQVHAQPIPQTIPGSEILPPPNSTATDHIPDVKYSITALVYTGVERPKKCSGNVMRIPGFPAYSVSLQIPTCFDLPTTAHCGVFIAPKDAACEVMLYSSSGCEDLKGQGFANLAVFMPEFRPVGAVWKSMKVQCGVDVPSDLELYKTTQVLGQLAGLNKGGKNGR